MKKFIYYIFVASVLFTGCKKDTVTEKAKEEVNPDSPDTPDTPDVQPVNVDPLASARKQCFFEDVENGTITFVFDSTLWKAKNAKKVEVRGSFNDWKTTDGYSLTKCDTAKVLPYWYLTVPYSMIKCPGNCGQPEYKFVVDGSWKNAPSWLPAGYKFSGNDVNQIIVFSTDDIEEIKAKSAQAAKKKSLSDFDLTTEAGKQDISNVRVVPGTSKLIRCYHPFKYTDKNRNNTEFKRVELVKEYFESYGIKSDICLSENEEKNLETKTFSGETHKESISPYYKEIIDNGAVLYVGVKTGLGTPKYETCYSDPKGAKTCGWIGEIIDFIASDETSAPYGIHCRLGTDRTGFFCAIIAALCGANVDEIMADYQRSNNMGIMEYRDSKKMKYTLEMMLDVDDLSQVSDLGAAIKNLLISGNYTTDGKVQKMLNKLK